MEVFNTKLIIYSTNHIMTERRKQKEIFPVIRSFCPKEQYREVCNIDLETPNNQINVIYV